MTDIPSITQKLEQHLVDTGFKGIDPHDGLNSPLVKVLTFGDRRLGVAALQFFKRCPLNLRPLFGIRPGINPKAHGLLTATYVQKFRMSGDVADLNRAKEFADWLIENRSPGCSGAAWGYNFDWPNRNANFPAGTPTLVNTAYIAEALLDLFEVTGDEKYKDAAVSSAEFLLNDLNRSGTDDEFCFSYTPFDRTQIHNANMLGAALLARIHSVISSNVDATPPSRNAVPVAGVAARLSSPKSDPGLSSVAGVACPEFVEGLTPVPSPVDATPPSRNAVPVAGVGDPGSAVNDRAYSEKIDLETIKAAAEASMLFSINRQQPDGSWLYGTEPRNSWIDSYHTGYNLLAIKRYINALGGAGAPRERGVALNGGSRPRTLLQGRATSPTEPPPQGGSGIPAADSPSSVDAVPSPRSQGGAGSPRERGVALNGGSRPSTLGTRPEVAFHQDLENSIKRGYSFYLDHFFTPEGFVKYYHDRTYPWDGHAMAHALLTLDELESLDPERSRAIRGKVIARIQDTFWDERRGCFIYLLNKRYANRIDYYRWVQCWMFYALMNHLLKESGSSEVKG